MDDFSFDDFGGNDLTGSVPSQPQANGSSNAGQGAKYAEEIFSKKIEAKLRTFYVDLRKSHNGPFLKISEKSRGGQKSTIMMDGGDVAVFIEALQEVQKHL